MYVYICIYKREVTYLYERITLYNNNIYLIWESKS